ncbi:hypothetical protein [Hufsiella ginkgonis]|uniref:Uncharacterized protein n=1 Tax=Hufsiella ginkgonis TaxID=2695274 RepID=A0A7K1Y1R8_9SPHI|nr:hypothetical protein [Hufsiella ginkgonis]MXV17028.1 hypothetical protein [Hufsiella ginkgonis]
MKLLKVVSGLCVWSMVAVSSFAQKLPDQQEVSLRPPANIKIDGKATEWPAFQAYNKSTSLFYTITNDDDNLYLAVQSTNSGITNKIMRGGLTFTVNTTGKKKEKEGISIMFPVPPKNDMMSMMQGMRTAMGGAGGPGGRPGQTVIMGGPPSGDPAAMMKRADSIMYEMNRQQIDKLKDIKVFGIKDITDSLLSIYNEEGIKARALFDGNRNYTYELAIPLKYLSITTNNPKEFTYNIKLNGMQLNLPPPPPSMAGGGAPTVVINGAPMGGGGMRMGGPGGIDFMSMFSVTDFWGKYTLAKK